jgi:predicted transcriptional regulator
MTLSERLKNFRIKYFLTTRETGAIFGVSQSEIVRLESGTNKPNLVTQARWEKKIKKAENELVEAEKGVK